MQDKTSNPRRPHLNRPHRRSKLLTPEAWLLLRRLSAREVEATLLVGQGLLLRVAAERMGVEPGTVKTLLARARGKLHCRSARELTALLLREGIIRPDQLLDPEGHTQGDRDLSVNRKLTKDRP